MKLLLLMAFFISIWTYTVEKRHKKLKYNKANETQGFPSSDEKDIGIDLDMEGYLKKLFFVISAETKPDSNTLCSPLSAILPLAKLALGAEGNSSRELLSAIGIPDKSQIAQQFKPLLFHLRYLPGVRLDIASRLYVSDKAHLNRKFTEAALDIFDSSVTKINFNYPTFVATEINTWVSSQTNGIIKELFKPTDVLPDSNLVLVNAVYFNGRWGQEFQKVEPKTFFTPTGLKPVQMMSLESDFNYTISEALGSKIISIPYSGNRATFVLVLPLSRTGLKPLLSALRLDPWMLQAVFRDMSSTRVHLSMPKFTVTADLDLADTYKKIGLKTVFDASQSRLTKIVRDETVHITSAKQKCYIQVNEYGTEAAAATGTVLTKLSLVKPEEFKAEHPFLYFIIVNNQQLFSGTLIDPQS